MKNNKRTLCIIQFLLPFVVLTGLFLLIPSVTVIIDSFKSSLNGGFTLENYKTALTNTFYLVSIKNSINISLISSLVGIVVALIAAYSISNLGENGQNRIITMLNMTSNFSGVPLALGNILLIGNSGIFFIIMKKMGIDIFSNFNLYSWSGLI